MKKTRKAKRIFVTIATLALSVFCVFDRSIVAMADNNSSGIQNFNETSIMDDLANVNLEGFDVDEKGVPQVIYFQEYCYSEKYVFSDYYGLYVYVYNPKAKPIDLNGDNTVSMATSYKEDGSVAEQDKFRLKHCDNTENHLYYKFEIDAAKTMLPIEKSYMEKFQKRRYDIAGIEYKLKGADMEEDYGHSTTYFFTGYAAGCASDASFADKTSTLACTSQKLDTIDFGVAHANYRFPYKEKIGDSTYRYDEVNTAYFSVDERYFTDYGGLQKIKAEWYEYKTNPIFVTCDESAFDALSPYVGVEIGERLDALPWRVLWEETVADTSELSLIYFLKAYNPGLDNDYNEYDNIAFTQYLWRNADPLARMDWLFYKNKDEISKVEDYKVSAGDVEDWMESYTSKYPDQVKVAGLYAQNLFAKSIDDARISLLDNPKDLSGHILQEISADKKYKDIIYSSDDRSWWDKLWGKDCYEKMDLDPIIVLTSKDMEGLTEDTFAEKYLISEQYQKDVFDYCHTAISEGKRPVLFRFAVTDYYTSEAYFDYDDNSRMSGVDGYVAQMSMFLKFDVISLTFRNAEQEETVIAVVSNPINIINGVDPAPNQTLPMEEWDWGGLFSMIGEGILYALLTICGAIVAVFALWILGKLLWLLFKRIAKIE